VALTFTFFLSPVAFLTSCTPDICNTPFGEGAVIDIYMPDFNALANVGGSVTINRGYKGIFVRRTSFSDFVAFECACPNDHEVRLVPDPDWEGDILHCPACGSNYETKYGNPLEGAASGCPLYEYRTHFDGYILKIDY
jgi:hypothetical protein